MRTFRDFLVESELTDFHAEISHHMSNGMIPNPKYLDLKHRVDRHAEKKGRALFEKHCIGVGDTLYKIDPGLGDLVYATPSNINDVFSLKNKLGKVKVKNHPFFQDLSQLHQELLPLAEKVKQLKSLVVKTSAIRAAAKQEKEIENKRKFGDPSTLHNALTKHLDEFKTRAHQYAGEHYEYMMDGLKKHGWDIDKAAPKPNSIKDSREDYLGKKAMRERLLNLTSPSSSENIRKPNKKIKAAYQEQAKQNAHDEYMAWVNKMTQKIGKPVAQAKASGSPWTGSRLDVTTHDGESQSWNTKMIINRSKYNTLFNQFPTRKVSK